MEIELLTVADCPNRRTALDRLEAALRVLDITTARITEQVIDDQPSARTAGMCGSPTILVDGIDPFASPDLDFSVSCRLYRSTNGPAGAPSVDDLVAALSNLVDARGEDD